MPDEFLKYKSFSASEPNCIFALEIILSKPFTFVPDTAPIQFDVKTSVLLQVAKSNSQSSILQVVKVFNVIFKEISTFLQEDKNSLELSIAVIVASPVKSQL
ncbi:MAG: hypothetical protein BWY38_03151 [Ignavibacteria bacterium ADurb.Bin266]|nr:MAG: hypothetical protein BWY38_03151 [Ignavibacteria bacterium ADurb.Bin266]